MSLHTVTMLLYVSKDYTGLFVAQKHLVQTLLQIVTGHAQ